MNLNPLAPAKSKLVFPFSGKTRKFIEMACTWASFFCLLVNLFHDFSLKIAKGSRVPPQSLKKTPKWTPKGTQMEPKVQPQGYKKCRKSATCSPRVPKRSPGCYNGAPRCHIGAARSHKCKTHRKDPPKLQKTHTRSYPKVPTKKKNHIPTNTQPTKETKRDTKKQTIEQTHTHAHELRTANTNSNSRGRVLAEGDVDPAAGSPKEPFRL